MSPINKRRRMIDESAMKYTFALTHHEMLLIKGALILHQEVMDGGEKRSASKLIRELEAGIKYHNDKVKELLDSCQ